MRRSRRQLPIFGGLPVPPTVKGSDHKRTKIRRRAATTRCASRHYAVGLASIRMRPGCKLVVKTVVRNLQALILRDQLSHRISIVVIVHRAHPCAFAARSSTSIPAGLKIQGGLLCPEGARTASFWRMRSLSAGLAFAG